MWIKFVTVKCQTEIHIYKMVKSFYKNKLDFSTKSFIITVTLLANSNEYLDNFA